jgi:hypothetical protein
MKKVFIQYKNLGKNLKNESEIYSDRGKAIPFQLSPTDLLNGSTVEIDDSASKVFVVPKIYDFLVSGNSNPQISELKFYKTTGIFNSNPIYFDENNNYGLWKVSIINTWFITTKERIGSFSTGPSSGFYQNNGENKPITGSYIGINWSGSFSILNVDNKLRVYNTPGITGFAGNYTSGNYIIDGISRTAFKNDINQNFYILKNNSPSEWRAIEELYNGPFTWYTCLNNNDSLPPVTGWVLGGGNKPPNISPTYEPVPEMNFGACPGNTLIYPDIVFKVNSYDRNLSLLKFYSGGLLNNDGTSNIFIDNINIEDLFPTAYGELFNKKFFYSNVVKNDRYYLFNSIDASNNYLKWYVAKINPSGSKYSYWASDFIDFNPNMTFESASTNFYPVNNDSASNFSISAISKYSNIRLSESKNINIENYSGSIYLNNPTFTTPSISVEDGGNEAANGVYIQSGTFNGYPRYVSTRSPLHEIINDLSTRTWNLRQFSGQQYYTIYSSNQRRLLAPTGSWMSRSAIVPQFAQISGSGSYILRSLIANSVANDAHINDNGTVIIVASGPGNLTFPNAEGAITIYTGNNNNFLPKQTIVGSYPTFQNSNSVYNVKNGFANSVDTSSNGSIIAIGGYNVKIYRGNPNGSGQNYVLQQTINTPNTSWNATDNNVAINGDGNILAVGSPYSDSGNGRVQIYRITGNNRFGLQQTIIGGYANMAWGFGLIGGYGSTVNGGFRFGDYVSLSTNGNVLAVGGYLSGMGAAYVYWRNDTGSLFSSRYNQWGNQQRVLGKWTTSVNDDGSVVCIGGYGGTILRGNVNAGSYIRLNSEERGNILTTTPISTNGDGSRILIGGYAGQAAIIYTGNKNLTGTNSTAFWKSGYALNLTGSESTPGITFHGTSNMSLILAKGLITNLYIQNNIIPILTGSGIITGASPTPESVYTKDYIIDDLNNDIYEFKQINSGKFNGPYFEGTNYIFANPEFKIDSYSGLNNLLISGTNVRPSGITGMKLYQINSTFLGNNIYTDLDQTYVLWKSGNSQIWNLTNNDPLIDGIFRGGFTGRVNVTEPFTGFNTSIGQFRASGSGFSGSFNIFPIGKLITGARCSNAGARIWTILDKNYNYVGWRNCNSGSGTFVLSNWGSGNPISSFNFDSINFDVIEFYKHKNNFIDGTNYLLGLNTGFNYSTVSGVLNLNTGNSFQFNLFNDPTITTTINYKNNNLYYGNINNLPMSFGIEGNYFSAYSSGNIARMNIQIGNKDVGYNIFRSGNNTTIEKFALSRAIIICR